MNVNVVSLVIVVVELLSICIVAATNCEATPNLAQWFPLSEKWLAELGMI